MSKKVYTEEFKKIIVDLYISGKGASELSREYGLPLSNIHKWVSLYKEVKTENGESYSKADVIRLQKELAKIKEENAILKKAVAIFSKQ